MKRQARARVGRLTFWRESSPDPDHVDHHLYQPSISPCPLAEHDSLSELQTFGRTVRQSSENAGACGRLAVAVCREWFGWTGADSRVILLERWVEVVKLRLEEIDFSWVW